MEGVKPCSMKSSKCHVCRVWRYLHVALLNHNRKHSHSATLRYRVNCHQNYAYLRLGKDSLYQFLQNIRKFCEFESNGVYKWDRIFRKCTKHFNTHNFTLTGGFRKDFEAKLDAIVLKYVYTTSCSIE